MYFSLSSYRGTIKSFDYTFILERSPTFNYVNHSPLVNPKLKDYVKPAGKLCSVHL